MANPLSMRRDMYTTNLTFKCLKGSPPMFFKDYMYFKAYPEHEGKWEGLNASQFEN